MRDHPDGLLGRLPAHEIESTVEGAIRTHLSDREKVSSLLDIDLNDEVEVIQKITDIQAAVSMDQFVRTCIEQVTVQPDRLEIKIRADVLSAILSDAAKVKINCTIDNKTFFVPYTTRRAKKGALVIAPEKQQKDIFDLPSNELKKLVQGFIWRNEHFSGMTLRDIAKREEFSEGYVGQCIFQTFEISLA